MSELLESRLTQEQRDECARNDAALIAEMFPMDPRPAHIPESEWEEADARYVADQKRRERDRLALLQELELAELRRAGL